MVSKLSERVIAIIIQQSNHTRFTLLPLAVASGLPIPMKLGGINYLTPNSSVGPTTKNYIGKIIIMTHHAASLLALLTGSLYSQYSQAGAIKEEEVWALMA